MATASNDPVIMTTQDGKQYVVTEGKDGMRWSTRYYPPAQFDDPGTGDVHVNTPLGSQSPSKARRSPMLKMLVRNIKNVFTTKSFVTQDDWDAAYRSALGHAGGKGRTAAEPADARICSAHLQGNPDNCTCDACMNGDPDDCICDSILEEQAEGEGETSTANPERVPQLVPAKRTSEPSPIGSASGEAFRLLLPLEAKEAPAAINYMPKPGEYDHPLYGHISITPERNARFVSNFHSGIYQNPIPINAEHKESDAGAMGWITSLRQNSDGSVDADVDWSDLGRDAFANDRYRFFSPEWHDEWQDNTGQVHTDIPYGGGLVQRPFFKPPALRPLVASEAGIYIPDEDAAPVPRTVSTSSHSQELPMAQTLTDDETKRFKEINPDADVKALTEGQITLFRAMDAALTAARTEAKQAAENPQDELRKARQATEAAVSESKAFAERVKALEVENRRRVFTEQAKGWQGETASHVSFLEGLPSDEMRATYIAQQDAQTLAFGEMAKAAKVFSAVGNTGITGSEGAMARLEAKAAELREKDPTLSKAKAFGEATRLNPDLYAEYQEEHGGFVAGAPYHPSA